MRTLTHSQRIPTASLLSSGEFQPQVDGVLHPGRLVIEAASNLSGWAPVFTNTTTTKLFFDTDPDAGHLSTRFYRAF